MATPQEYLQTARLFYHQIRKGGHCMGNAMMGAQALCIPDLKSYIKRLETIYYGALKPGTVDQRISLDDLKKLYDKINSGTNEDVSLDDKEGFFSGIFSKWFRSEPKPQSNIQFEQSLPENKEDIDKEREEELEEYHPEAQTFIKAWYTLIDQLKNFNSSSTIQHTILNENQFPSSLSTVSNTAVLKPQELHEQVMLAQKIQKAYLEKYGKQKLASFLYKHPYITQLMDIDIFFSNIALYQVPQKFKDLLPENLRIRPEISIQQKLPSFFMPILSSVSLDSKNAPGFIQLDQFSNRYNNTNLQILLNELANQIETHYPSENNIPFALRIESHNHAICLGYDIAKKSWIYIESNVAFPSSVPKTNIGTVVMSAFFEYQRSIQGAETEINLAYDLKKNKWILLSAVNSMAEVANERQENLAKALLQSDQLIHLKSLQCNLSICVYANIKFKFEVNAILDAWKTTDQFKQINLLAGFKLTTPDDLGDDYLLHFACTNHDINTIWNLLNARVDVNLIDDSVNNTSFVNTALNQAVIKNYVDIANLLLEHKANPNILGTNKASALFVAVQENYNEIAFSLIKNNADLNFECIGQTPLMKAIINNNLTLFEALIEAKADIDFQCKNRNVGMPAIFIAAQVNNLACVNRLIQLNANVNILFQGHSALFKAIEINNLEIVNALIEAKSDIDLETPRGINTLSKAAMANSLPILERLLEAKANVNYTSKNANLGATPLFFAIQYGAKECAQRLIAAGADMNMGIENTTPLLAAIKTNKMPMFDLLIQAKVDVNYKRNDFAHTALYFATQEGNLDYVIKLIAAKADVTAECNGNLSTATIEDSLLYKACENDKIRELLKEEFQTRKNQEYAKNTINDANVKNKFFDDSGTELDLSAIMQTGDDKVTENRNVDKKNEIAMEEYADDIVKMEDDKHASKGHKTKLKEPAKEEKTDSSHDQEFKSNREKEQPEIELNTSSIFNSASSLFQNFQHLLGLKSKKRMRKIDDDSSSQKCDSSKQIKNKPNENDSPEPPPKRRKTKR